jgi:hypothetical protein
MHFSVCVCVCVSWVGVGRRAREGRRGGEDGAGEDVERWWGPVVVVVFWVGGVEMEWLEGVMGGRGRGSCSVAKTQTRHARHAHMQYSLSSTRSASPTPTPSSTPTSQTQRTKTATGVLPTTPATPRTPLASLPPSPSSPPRRHRLGHADPHRRAHRNCNRCELGFSGGLISRFEEGVWGERVH